MTCKKIPIAAARRIAKEYGYDQVVIIARKVGPNGGEHVTTYGVDVANYAVAGKTAEPSDGSAFDPTLYRCDAGPGRPTSLWEQIGDFLKHKDLIYWP